MEIVWFGLAVIFLQCLIESLGAPLVRLDPGPDSGRLEVFYKEKWGTVCSGNFENKAAAMVCRFLNQPAQNAYRLSRNFEVGTPILSRVSCSGNEPSLLNCSLTDWDNTKKCYSSDIIGLVCTNDIAAPFFKYGDVYFSNGARVDVYVKGYYSLCCHASNDTCHMGFEYEMSKTSLSHYGYGACTSVARLDIGATTCTVSNLHMKKQASVTVDLNVLYPPDPFRTSVYKVMEGRAVDVSLTDRCNPPPSVTSWLRTETGARWVQTENHLVYPNITRSDAGVFLVNITNYMNSSDGQSRSGNGLDLVILNVLYSPTLTCQPEYVVRQGARVNITCDVRASPAPHVYIWTDNSGKIVVKGSSPSMVIPEAGPENTGRYKCTAVNKMVDTLGESRSGIGVTTVLVSLDSQIKRPIGGDVTTYVLGAIMAVLVLIIAGLVVYMVKAKKENNGNAAMGTQSPEEYEMTHRHREGYSTLDVLRLAFKSGK